LTSSSIISGRSNYGEKDGNDMETAWYLRLFYMPILSAIIAYLLSVIIKPKRMTDPGPGKPWLIVGLIQFIGLLALMWFVPFSINLAFWIGIGIIVFGHVVNGLAYSAMREHPEKQKVVVDWGIYKVIRHPHALHGSITSLGAIVMGWNTESTIYIILWAYFVLNVILTHFALLSEEKINIGKFGQEYADYMKSVPRYFPIKVVTTEERR